LKASVWRLFLEGRGTEAYKAVLLEAHAQADLAARGYEGFLFDLGQLGVRILSMAELTLEEKHHFGAYLAEEVAPQTDVIRAEGVRDMRSHALYFASGAATPTSLIRMPESVPRLLEVPGKPFTYVRLGELLHLRPDLFLTGKGTRLHELRAIRLAATPAGALPLADASRRLEAVHPGHLAIHQDEVEGRPLEGLEGLEAIGGHRERGPHALEHLLGELLID
jgi:polyphosphate kinase